MSAASSSGGQTASSLPLMLRQHLRAFRMDWTASSVELLAVEVEASPAGDERRWTETCRSPEDRVTGRDLSTPNGELERAVDDRVLRLVLEEEDIALTRVILGRRMSNRAPWRQWVYLY